MWKSDQELFTALVGDILDKLEYRAYHDGGVSICFKNQAAFKSKIPESLLTLSQKY